MEESFKINHRLKIALIASVVLHAIFFSYKFHYNTSLETAYKAEDLIELTVEDIEKYKKNNARAENKKQIVNTEDRGRNEALENSRFLGEKNQTYDRQTIASQVDTFNKAALGERAGSINSQAIDEQVNNDKSKESSLSGLGKKLSLKDIALTPDMAKDQAEKIANLQKPKLGVKNGDRHSRGLSANNDFVETVPLGDFTQLNTTEFKYYGFYHRIREKLEQFWGNSIREKAKNIYASGRRLPATENLITSLVVDINERGEIIKVKIIGSSGVRELDDAAVESFNKAGPFPNPPSGMLRNGYATVEWGFVVKS